MHVYILRAGFDAEVTSDISVFQEEATAREHAERTYRVMSWRQYGDTLYGYVDHEACYSAGESPVDYVYIDKHEVR